MLNDIPFHVVLSIVEQGHSLNASHVSLLSERLNISEIKILENYGVDFTKSSDIFMTNALIQSIKNNDEEVFSYLSQKSSLIHSDKFDVMDQALKVSIVAGNGFDKVRILLDKDLILSENTKNWAEKEVKPLSPELYYQIMNLDKN